VLRNREIRHFLFACVVIVAIGTSCVFLVNPLAGVITFLTITIISICFMLFTMWRYREIRRLSDYLVRVYTGGQPLDIRDNTEGELSILKNDIYKVTLTLSEQSELLKKDKRYLADALSDISHQLKTPLTSMFVMTELLGDTELPQERREEFLANIHQQLERIQWLVSSLLKISKIDAQAVDFKKEQVQVSELIDKASAPLLIPMELKEQQLIITCEDSIYWTGDFGWTAEALLNVLKNCVEHTPTQGIIRISCTENPLHIEVAISDNGSGIAKEDLPLLFNRFYKGKNACQDSVGIGLAMAKTILQNQNANIYVESESGVGTKFTIKFYKQDAL
jgi:signal transduction histidine kinase